jgi:hypothetical protein
VFSTLVLNYFSVEYELFSKVCNPLILVAARPQSMVIYFKLLSMDYIWIIQAPLVRIPNTCNLVFCVSFACHLQTVCLHFDPIKNCACIFICDYKGRYNNIIDDLK